ncbi:MULTISPECIES: Clp protease N-terminal domain-containing protein [Catenuloplanes]|uniref:PucR family transcriptional regulator n=1 Tax=Catenuloplanes niger TaxID=587534 RepID=A0AAE4CRC2_9ACTN|nr:Clp protease N-terminal domain-containing protein [Catenuloplanes niger]MDR7320008.1 hypothetical protein [Catenuloplanes niger]
MTEQFTVGKRLTSSLHKVRGMANGPVGTGALLWSIADDREVAPLLDAFDISARVVFAVMRTPGRVWREPDTGAMWDPDAEPRTGPFEGVPAVRDETTDLVMSVSVAAAEALRGEVADSRVLLLAAMLANPDSEASAVIRDCGEDPAQVRAAALAGAAPARPDRLVPELRPARDALLGRVRYRGRGLRDRLLLSVLARQVNHADEPVFWARLEADERAREQGRTTRTDDLLRALLATHEVVLAYPHLGVLGRDKRAGGDALLAQGIDHQRVRSVAPDDRPDEVPVSVLIKPGPDFPTDTGVLLDRLAAHPGNRSARILGSLGYRSEV